MLTLFRLASYRIRETWSELHAGRLTVISLAEKLSFFGACLAYLTLQIDSSDQ